MILNVFNYPGDSLEKLSHRAIDGGIQGIAKEYNMISKKLKICNKKVFTQGLQQKSSH